MLDAAAASVAHSLCDALKYFLHGGDGGGGGDGGFGGIVYLVTRVASSVWKQESSQTDAEGVREGTRALIKSSQVGSSHVLPRHDPNLT